MAAVGVVPVRSSTTGADHASLSSADDPHHLPGWDELAASGSFYVSADWLAYADVVGVPGRYHLAHRPDGVSAAVSAHWSPRESPEYDARAVLGDAGAITQEASARADPTPEGTSRQRNAPVLTLGGRRGFRSGLLLGGPPAEAAGLIPALVDRAVAEVPATGGRWWWPYLTFPEARRLAGALRESGRAPDVHHLGADCVVDVVGTGPEDQAASLPLRQRRTNLRREIRRFADSGLRLRRVDLTTEADRLAPLLAQVQHKYGHDQSVAELAELLRRQGERLGEHAVTLVCTDGSRTIGFSLSYRWGDELAVRVVGLDYQGLTGAEEYAHLLFHGPLAHCHELGLRRLHLGTDSWAAKCRRGARLRPLWAVTSEGLLPEVRRSHRLATLRDHLPRHEFDHLRAEVHSCLDLLDHDPSGAP